MLLFLAVPQLIAPCIVEQARDLSKHLNMPISISHYLNNMSKLTSQWNGYNYKDPDRQRIYLKDIDCPEVWHDKLREQIPPGVFYLNDSTGEPGGPGSVDEPNPSGSGMRKGRGVSRAGDLMSCLPPAMRADNMQCYIGHEGTYTPAHREMCASLGQNIMVETSGTVDEHGQPCKPGSSIWFMTETKERHLVSEYWLSTLGHDIEVESHFAQINAWKAAPFKTYVVEQQVGDFLLIPPLAPHQVWNRGTRTMKAAWNRTTVETLEMALNEALPRARMVCRDEQYKNKAIVMFALERYSNLLKSVEIQKQTAGDPQDAHDLTYSPKIRQLQKDFRRLFSLFSGILLSEMLPPVAATEKRGQYLPYDSYVTCSYCRCNVFNRFLTCTSCIIPMENGEEDTYDICMDCYAMGRSCKCISRYKWVEQFPWQDLVQRHEDWRLQIIGFDGNRVTDKSPQSLQVQRKNMTKKTLAQVCYEQLKARPWCNPKKEPENSLKTDLLLEEDMVNDDGTLRKRRKGKRQSEILLRGTARCHISNHIHPRWKVAVCECGRGYHYGTLFRAFDVMPLTVMEDPDWKCPYCLKICSCSHCRKLPGMCPFEPNGTILGHDTKKVADPRSVESLVDFSHSNIGWIKKAGDNDLYETRRLRRRKDEAALDKSKDADLDDHYVNEEEFTPLGSQHPDNGITYNMEIDLPIDPMLRMEQVPTSQSEFVNGEIGESRQTSQHDELAIRPGDNQNSHSGNSHATSDNGIPIRLAAPAAVMVDREPGTNTALDNKGIIYQYPDPTLPQFAPSPRRNNRPPPKTAQYNGQQDNMRRKQQEAESIVQSDLVSSPKGDANEQYHHAQMQRALVEAKRNDRFISAEAAITGKRLQLILPINRIKLAAFTQQSRPSLEGDQVENENIVILQSDVPSVLPEDPSESNASTKKRKVQLDEDQSDIPSVPLQDPPESNRPIKKRKVRVDKDEALPTRRNPVRKSVTTRADLPSDVRKLSFSYAEVPSESDNNVPALGRRTPVKKLREPSSSSAEIPSESDDNVPALGRRTPVKKLRKPSFSSAEIPSGSDDNVPALERRPSVKKLHQPSFSSAEITSDSEKYLPAFARRTPPVEKLRKPRTLPAHLSPGNNVSQSPRSVSAASLDEGSHHTPRKDPPQSKKRKARSPTTSVSEASTPLSNAPVPIDSFQAEPLPKPDAAMDLSMLGPGETTVHADAAAKQAAKNRKAKLKALHWAEAGTDVSDSSTSTRYFQ